MSSLTNKDAMLERAVAALEKIKTALGEINPTGVIQAFAGDTLPDGWLLCDGSAVSRTKYAGLFAVIGTTYGSGDGSTTFNLPNLTDKFIEGSSTVGTEKTAGLPNIEGNLVFTTGTVGGNFVSLFPWKTGGAFARSESESAAVWNASGTPRDTASEGVTMDASRSSSIYGNSTTVQPPALTMQYIIKY